MPLNVKLSFQILKNKQRLHTKSLVKIPVSDISVSEVSDLKLSFVDNTVSLKGQVLVFCCGAFSLTHLQCSLEIMHQLMGYTDER